MIEDVPTLSYFVSCATTRKIKFEMSINIILRWYIMDTYVATRPTLLKALAEKLSRSCNTNWEKNKCYWHIYSEKAIRDEHASREFVEKLEKIPDPRVQALLFLQECKATVQEYVDFFNDFDAKADPFYRFHFEDTLNISERSPRKKRIVQNNLGQFLKANPIIHEQWAQSLVWTWRYVAVNIGLKFMDIIDGSWIDAIQAYRASGPQQAKRFLHKLGKIISVEEFLNACKEAEVSLEPSGRRYFYYENKMERGMFSLRDFDLPYNLSLKMIEEKAGPLRAGDLIGLSFGSRDDWVDKYIYITKVQNGPHAVYGEGNFLPRELLWELSWPRHCEIQKLYKLTNRPFYPGIRYKPQGRVYISIKVSQQAIDELVSWLENAHVYTLEQLQEYFKKFNVKIPEYAQEKMVGFVVEHHNELPQIVIRMHDIDQDEFYWRVQTNTKQFFSALTWNYEGYSFPFLPKYRTLRFNKEFTPREFSGTFNKLSVSQEEAQIGLERLLGEKISLQDKDFILLDHGINLYISGGMVYPTRWGYPKKMEEEHDYKIVKYIYPIRE